MSQHSGGAVEALVWLRIKLSVPLFVIQIEHLSRDTHRACSPSPLCLSSQLRSISFHPLQRWRERTAPFYTSAVWITDRVEHRLTDDSGLSHSLWLRTRICQAQLRLFGPSAQCDSELPHRWVEPLCGCYRLQC